MQRAGCNARRSQHLSCPLRCQAILLVSKALCFQAASNASIVLGEILLALERDRSRHQFKQMKDLLGRPDSSYLLTEPDDTIKASLCTQFVLWKTRRGLEPSLSTR